MNYVALGKSNLLVSRTALGAMALADIKDDVQAGKIIAAAYEGGINFFDTSHKSLESECRLGNSLNGEIRKNIYVATKTSSLTSWKIQQDVEESLTALKTDYIDLYQLDNPPFIPKENGEDGIVETLKSLKKQGLIHNFGVCTENYDLAKDFVDSTVEWDTLQFPFHLLCTKNTLNLAMDCREKEVGFIAMQPLCGGIIQNIPLALGFFSMFDSVVPVWGAHTEEELRQILYFSENPPVIDEKFKEEIEKTRDFFN